MKLLVISPTANPVHAERMIATARRVGIEPMLYGLTSNHPHGKDYQGTDIVEILRTRTDAEYVMGVDAPDVAFVGGEQEIIEKLENCFIYPMLVSGEREGVRGMDKTQEQIHLQCIADGGYHPQLNIGCWIGKREYTLDVFNEAERLFKDKPENPDYSYDNHYQYLCLMKAWGGESCIQFHIDTKCVVFQSMNQTRDDLEWDSERRRMKNKVTGTWPAVLHYNGDPTRGAYNEMVKEILR